ncbi:MAG: hypothetical protein JWM31_301 [Solirubrobacterales bacterium]|nr:hypothetical protein [Solirubrobacterales bacterium]
MLDVAEAAGIHRIVVPTPFGVGDVNCYLIEDDPLTLVDCGPNSATSLLALEAGLAARGHRLEDVGLLVVTHQHIDHMGLAHVFATRGHAQIACLDDLVPILADWDTHAVDDDDDALLVMRRHGVEEHVAVALRAVADIVRGWGASSRVDRGLTPGSTLALAGRELEILFRPGHSPSDIVLVDHAHRIALGGDHLLAGISSNAVLSRPLTPDWDGRRPTPLLAYRDSLQKTADLDVDVILGGHGVPVTGHRALVADRLADQDRRAASLLKRLADGPRTAHEIATSIWGTVAVTQVFLTLSEVLGHLDLLISRGQVTEDRSAEVIRFARA